MVISSKKCSILAKKIAFRPLPITRVGENWRRFFMIKHGIHLPEGLSLEQLDELAAQRARQKRNEYNAKHPEVVMRRRIAASINLLTRHGYVVLPPNKAAEGATT